MASTTTPLLSDKKKSCACTETGWIAFFKIFSLVLVVLTLVVVIMSTVFVAQQDALQRYCLFASSGEVVGGVGEAGGKLWGPFSLDSNENRLVFEFRTNAVLSNVQSIHIKGPIVVGTETGPIIAVLCGAPSPLPACDTFTTPGTVKKTYVTKIYDGINPPSDVSTLIPKIRENPSLYYLEVLTSGTPVTPGAVRAPLSNTCGTP